MRPGKAYRLMAMILLILAGTDLLVVDFASSFLCDQGELPASTETFPDDDCFCCCAHIIGPRAPLAAPTLPANAFEAIPLRVHQSALSITIYHPPRG